MFKTVLLLLLVLYLGLGLGMWYIGMHDIGGKEVYIQYLKDTHNYKRRGTYYLLLLIFIFSWPAFIVFESDRKRNEK